VGADILVIDKGYLAGEASGNFIRSQYTETRFLPNFERVARRCIADGAEIIIVGCGYYGPILSVHGCNKIPGTRVPVIDCSAAGLKLAEAQVDLQKSLGLSKNTALYFKPTPTELLKSVRQANAML